KWPEDEAISLAMEYEHARPQPLDRRKRRSMETSGPLRLIDLKIDNATLSHPRSGLGEQGRTHCCGWSCKGNRWAAVVEQLNRNRISRDRSRRDEIDLCRVTEQDCGSLAIDQYLLIRRTAHRPEVGQNPIRRYRSLSERSAVENGRRAPDRKICQ